MKHFPVYFLLMLLATSCATLPMRMPASAATPSSRAAALERFREFASSRAVMFGEPKGSQVTFDAGQDRFTLYIGKREVGSAELFQQCAAALPAGGEISVRCFYGVNGKVGKQELAVAPQVNSDGYPMPMIGRAALEPHFQGLMEEFRDSPAARQALAIAMQENGCRKVDLGDSGAQVMWQMQAALGDEDSGKLIPGTENIWRASLPCKDGNSPVYFDVTQRAVAEKEAQLFLTPVKASAGKPVFVRSITPEL
jgi:hypothetical protein